MGSTLAIVAYSSQLLTNGSRLNEGRGRNGLSDGGLGLRRKLEHERDVFVESTEKRKQSTSKGELWKKKDRAEQDLKKINEIWTRK